MPLAKTSRHHASGIPVQYLICGGGGPGGYGGEGTGRCAGGGGGGIVLTGSQTLTSLTNYPVVIGIGGRLPNPPVDGTNRGTPGGVSSFLGRTAGSGGPGGDAGGESDPEHNGWVGLAGDAGANTGGGGGSPNGTGINGGANAAGSNNDAGGGGGMSNTATATYPNGSDGLVSSITGTPIGYGPGGGGGTELGTIEGGLGGNGNTGGMGGGQFGGGRAPTAYGGGGGGAGQHGGMTAGKAGVVIVSYDGLIVRASGGTITQAIGRTIHTFTANGTFTTI